jgi:hypothetical protein
MRRTMLTAVLAGCAGFCLATAAAYGYAKLDAWRTFGENFQLGYVVGYLDAVALNKRHDTRVWIPASAKPNYERWRAMVNDYFADPANAERPVPDGMAAAGKILQAEMVKEYQERAERLKSAPSPSPDAVPSGKASPAASP